VGSSDFRSLIGALAIVIAHMLKWDYQPRRRSASWLRSIEEHRARARRVIARTPGLASRVDDAVETAYRKARRIASAETKLTLSTFPETCPYAPADILNREFVLKQNEANGG
jgi:hypothetical protein